MASDVAGANNFCNDDDDDASPSANIVIAQLEARTYARASSVRHHNFRKRASSATDTIALWSLVQLALLSLSAVSTLVIAIVR